MKKNGIYSLKAFSVLSVIFSIGFLLFSIYAITGALYNKLWGILPIIFFVIFLGITCILFSYNTFLLSFRHRRSSIITNFSNVFFIFTFLYLTALSAYFYFFEKDTDALKSIIFGLIVSFFAIFNYFISKKA